MRLTEKSCSFFTPLNFFPSKLLLAKSIYTEIFVSALKKKVMPAKLKVSIPLQPLGVIFFVLHGMVLMTPLAFVGFSPSLVTGQVRSSACAS